MPDLLTSIDRLEKLYLTTMLGSAVGVNDTIQDLRRKFYGGIADGTTGLLGALGLQSYVSGRFYLGLYNPGSSNVQAMVLQQVNFVPIIIFKQTTFAAIGISVNVAAATAICRLGIYNDGGGRPTTRVKEFGSTVDASTTGFKEIVEATVLSPGIYWLAVVNQTAIVTLEARNTNENYLTSQASGADVIANNGTPRQSAVAGALPTPAVQDSIGASCPTISLRAA